MLMNGEKCKDAACLRMAKRLCADDNRGLMKTIWK